MDKGLEILAEVKQRARRAGADRRARRRRDRRRWPRWSTCCRRRRSCAARPISSAPWRSQRQAGQHQEGPVPRARRHEERGRQGAAAASGCRTTSWSASAARPSATTTWSPTCARSRSCARPAARWCSTPRTRCSCRAGRARSSGGQREFVPVLARAAVAAGVAGRLHGNAPEPDKALSDGPNAVAAAHDEASCSRRCWSSTRW